MEPTVKFLLIEDDVKVAELLRQAFAETGHETTVRGNAVEGLAYLGDHQPDAIFLGIPLPKVNGIEILQRIKATHPALPVVILAGQATASEVAHAKRLGVAWVIEKPYVLRHFSEALDRIARPGFPQPRGRVDGKHHRAGQG